MNRPLGSGRFDLFGDRWKLLTLRLIGTIGAIALCIQLIVFPVLGMPTNGTTCQWALGAGLGWPIAGLLKGSQRE